jgi:putative modified peptide
LRIARCAAAEGWSGVGSGSCVDRSETELAAKDDAIRPPPIPGSRLPSPWRIALSGACQELDMSAFKLPEPVIDRLLDKLGNDDAFRDYFVADTRGALASVGFAPAADASVTNGLWLCLAVDHLASKETFRNSRKALRNQLEPDGVFFPFLFGMRETITKAAA